VNNPIALLQGRRGDLAMLIAGLCLPLSFAPFHLWPLALLSMLLLFLGWMQVSAKQAFWRGWLFGVGMFSVGVSWVHVSMNRFGGVEETLSMGLTLLFALFLALFPALAGWLVRRFRAFESQPFLQLVLLMPVAWLLLEWARSWVLTGFPWLSLGYAQIDGPLAGWAPLFGVFGLSLFTVTSAGLLGYLWLQGKAGLRRVLPLLAAIWLLPVMLNTVDWSEPTGEPISVAMIQGNVSQDMKWRPEQRIPTLDLYANLSRENWGTDLIIWPETAVPALYHQIKPFLHAVAQEARMNNSELLVGIPVYDEKEKHFFNSMLSLGGTEKFYTKRHLVPFGEYLPMPELLGGVIDFFQIPMSNFERGNPDEQPTLRLAGQLAGISICYEDAFGDEVIESLPDATFLVNASNDAWFGDSVAPHQHLQIARMRSLETARYMLRSTNTGVSAIIDPKGDLITTSPQFEVDVLKGEIQPRTGMTPFAVFGNLPVVLYCLFSLLVLILISVFRPTRN